MSYVTNVMVTTAVLDSVGEDEGDPGPPAMEALGFRRVPRELPGGRKFMECEIYLAAFNHYGEHDNLDDLVNAVLSVRWEHLDRVQVFVKDEHDEKFKEQRAQVFGRARGNVAHLVDELGAREVLNKSMMDVQEAVDEVLGGAYGRREWE